MTDAGRARICATCAESSAVGNQKLVEAGYLRCKHLPVWEWISGHRPCRLQPVRWAPREVAA